MDTFEAEATLGEATQATEEKRVIYIRHPVSNAAYALEGPMAETVWLEQFEPNGFEIFSDSEELYAAVDSGPDAFDDDETDASGDDNFDTNDGGQDF